MHMCEYMRYFLLSGMLDHVVDVFLSFLKNSEFRLWS